MRRSNPIDQTKKWAADDADLVLGPLRVDLGHENSEKL